LFIEIIKWIVWSTCLAWCLGMFVRLIRHVVIRHLGAVHFTFIELVVGSITLLGGRSIRASFLFDFLVVSLVATRLLFVVRVLRLLGIKIIVAEVLRHLHGRKHMPNKLCEYLLVLERALQAIEVGCSLFLDERPPKLKDLAGTLRYFSSSE